MRFDRNTWMALAALTIATTGVAYAFWRDERLVYFLSGLILLAGFALGIALLLNRASIIRQQERDIEQQEEEIRSTKERLRDLEKSKTKTFKIGKGQSYNEAFYDYFIQKLESANRSVYITGEGFDCLDKEGEEFAQRFADAHALALTKHPTLHIERIQTQLLISKAWKDMLQDLLQRYPGRFNLFLEPRKTDRGPIVSVCVIDSESEVDSTVELMVSVNRIVSGRSANKASIGFFCENDGVFARDMLEKITEAKNEAGSRPISSIDENVGQEITIEDRDYFLFDPFEKPGKSKGYEFYYAYGSNMDEAKMVDRCPSAESHGIGTLVGHELVFNRKGDFVEGGVASVVRNPTENVYGKIYTMSDEDLQQLDDEEVKTSYHRVPKSILTEDGEVVECYMYVTFPQGIMTADPGYLEGMIAAAGKVGLPDEYISELKSFRL